MSAPLVFDVLARDQASETFSKVAESTGVLEAGVGGATGALDAIGAVLGGEVQEVLGKVGEGFQLLTEDGAKFGKTMMAAGGIATAAGALLSNMASADQAAEDQLRQSIENTGASWETYEGQVGSVIKRMEAFGHEDGDTQAALQSITQATQDPTKAFANMGLAADLAAASHTSLADAGAQIAKVYAGSGRVLKQYGIEMATGGDKTANADAALRELATRLSGQATAATDNFSGKVAAARARVSDWAEEMAGHVAPVLTASGPIIFAIGAIIDSKLVPSVGRAIAAKFGWVAATSAAVAEEEVLAVSTTTESVALTEQTAALGANTAALAAKAAGTQLALISTEELLVADTALQLDLFAETGALEASTAATAANAAAREADAAAAAQQAAATATAGGAGALGAGASRLATFGAVGLAVGAVLGVVGFAMHEAGRESDRLAEATQNLSAAYQEDGDAVGIKTAKGVADALMTSGAIEQANKLGISTKTVTEAALGNADAYAQVQAATRGVTDDQQKLLVSSKSSQTSQEKDRESAMGLLNTIDAQRGGIQNLIDTTKQQEEAQRVAAETMAESNTTTKETLSDLATQYGVTDSVAKTYIENSGLIVAADGSVSASAHDVENAIATYREAMGQANSTQADYIKALDTFAQSAGTAADKAELIGATLRDSQGDQLSYDATLANATKTQFDFKGALDETALAAINNSGQIDLNAEGASTLTQNLQALQSQAVEVAKATYQHEVGLKGAAAASDDAANAFMALTTGALTQNYDQLGLTKGQADGLAATYFAMPDDVKTLVQQEGSDQAKAEVKSLYDYLQANIAGHTFVGQVSITGAAAAAAAAANIARINSYESTHGNAVGGFMQPGLTNVGEFGKEQVRWDGPGTTPYVSSNAQTRSAATSASSGGGDTYITLSVGGSVVAERDLVSALASGLDQLNRQNGRDVLFGSAPRR